MKSEGLSCAKSRAALWKSAFSKIGHEWALQMAPGRPFRARVGGIQFPGRCPGNWHRSPRWGSWPADRSCPGLAWAASSGLWYRGMGCVGLSPGGLFGTVGPGQGLHRLTAFGTD